MDPESAKILAAILGVSVVAPLAWRALRWMETPPASIREATPEEVADFKARREAWKLAKYGPPGPTWSYRIGTWWARRELKREAHRPTSR